MDNGRAPSGQALVQAPSPSVSAASGFDPSRILREIFPRAYRDWRDGAIEQQDYDSFIPWRGDDLLELLMVDFERRLALASVA